MIFHQPGPAAARHTRLLKSSKFKNLTWEEVKNLFVAVRAGSLPARNAVIQANVKFAVAVALKYQGRGLDFEDLVSEANLGLSRAVDHFEEKQGCKFISYAVWWVRQGILQALARQGRAIAVPPSVMGGVKKVEWARSRLEQAAGRAPTVDAIAEATGLRPEAVLESMGLREAVMSLDMPVSADDSITLADIIPDPQAATDRRMNEHADRMYLADLLGSLPENERYVLRAYFGLDTGLEGLNLEAVGQQMDLTRERVRQIKENALARLRKKIPTIRKEIEA